MEQKSEPTPPVVLPGEPEATPSSGSCAEPHHAHDDLSSREFRIFAASRRGRSHELAGKPREDVFALAVGDPHWWFAAVADGAGSRSRSRLGAEVATNAAVSYVRGASNVINDPTIVLNGAARSSVEALQARALQSEYDIADLACTLLLLLWTSTTEGGCVTTFQAGDGLIASISEDGTLVALNDADEESFAGSTHFITGTHVQNTWEQRVRTSSPQNDTRAFLLMSDGVADDLIPYQRNGPILARELSRIAKDEQPATALLNDVLAYHKRGSFDDRTMVVGWRQIGV